MVIQEHLGSIIVANEHHLYHCRFFRSLVVVENAKVIHC